VNALFDLDGTLCDPSEGILLGFRHAFDALGRPFPGDARALALIGRPLQDCFEALGLGGDSRAAALKFHAYFEERGHAEGRLYEGALECLQGIKGAGWGAALASAKPSFAVRFVAEDLGLLPWLDGCFGCAPDDLKPDKRAIVAQALESLAWDPSDTVLIGDRDADRDAAAAHGLAFVAADWGFGGEDELAGAAARAASPRDLARLLAGLETLPSHKRRLDFI
jgi:phosphoglycolate phosphatase